MHPLVLFVVALSMHGTPVVYSEHLQRAPFRDDMPAAEIHPAFDDRDDEQQGEAAPEPEEDDDSNEDESC